MRGTPRWRGGRGTYDDVPGQVDAVGHGGDLLEGVQHGAVRAAHGAPVLVLGIPKLVEAGGAGALRRPQASAVLRLGGPAPPETSILIQCWYLIV